MTSPAPGVSVRLCTGWITVVDRFASWARSDGREPLSLVGFGLMSRVIGRSVLAGERAVPADDAAGRRGCSGRGFAVQGVVGLLAGDAELEQDDGGSYGGGDGRGGEDGDGDHLSASDRRDTVKARGGTSGPIGRLCARRRKAAHGRTCSGFWCVFTPADSAMDGDG